MLNVPISLLDLAAIGPGETIAESFQGSVELARLAELPGDGPARAVRAIPGHGTKVPLYILGSSLFGAQLAATLGLPYAFASHFAPALLHDAVRLYRERFTPSAAHSRPHVIAGVNVIAADSDDEAAAELEITRRVVVRNLIGRTDEAVHELPDEMLLRTPQAAFVEQMFTYRAVGSPSTVLSYLERFQRQAAADELITVHHAPSVAARLRSVRLLAEAAGLAATSG